MKRYLFDDGCIEHSESADEATGEAFYLASEVDARIDELEDKVRIAQAALDNIYGWSSTLRERCHPEASRNVAGWINDKARDARKSLMER